jgi:hypothetical protein
VVKWGDEGAENREDGDGTENGEAAESTHSWTSGSVFFLVWVTSSGCQ